MIWIFSKPQLNFKKKKKRPIFSSEKKHTLFISSCIVQLQVLGMRDSFSVPGFSNHTAFDLVPSSAG